MKWSPLAEKIHQSLKQSVLLKEKDKILVAVSGGMDSIVLLHVLLELREVWGWELIVGHIDHGFRPVEDKRETELCLRHANKAGLEFRTVSLDLMCGDRGSPTFYGSQNQSKEAIARNERYRAFEQWAQELGCDAICTGHHKSDQAETILYRLLTGSGLKGLSGIPAIRGIYKRPLLSVSKEDIRDYAEKNELEYLDDSSNTDETFIRNRIRHTVLPFIREQGFENVEDMLASSSASIEEANAALEYYGEKALKDAIVTDTNSPKLKIDEFSRHPVFIKKMVLRKLCKSYLNIDNHISEKQLDQLLTFISNSETGASTVLMEYRLMKDRELILFQSGNNDKVIMHVKCRQSSDLQKQTLNIDIITITPDTTFIIENKSAVYFSYEILNREMILRQWEAGDSMRLFGSGKTKKVSDILKDEKVNVLDKKDHPVLLIDNEIIWIPGVKRSNLYKVNKSDKKMIVITYKHGVGK